jgi:Methylase involved in ubiquinone/menaquinone biosynthesis
VDTAELQLLTSLEDHHWWYRERRAILRRELRRLPEPGRALDIGAAGGGNTRVLKEHGWQAVALEYSDSAADVARSRGIRVMRADARELPIRSGTCGLVTAFDVLEHIDEDYLAAAEMARVLQPGGTALIAVPCDMALWSAHDDAVGHMRRYSRPELASLIQKAGLTMKGCGAGTSCSARPWPSGGNPPPAATLARSPPWPTAAGHGCRRGALPAR